MGAREFFESVRAASRDASNAKEELEEMEERRLSLGSPGAGSVSGSHADVNGTARSIALVDREAALHRRVEGDYALIQRACDVIFGTDNDRGIELGLGKRYADVVWHRACGDESWPQVARSLKLSQSTCYRCYAIAMDYCDSAGYFLAREGGEV